MIVMKPKEAKDETSFNSNVYCLVGNIKDLREYGQNHELRTGVKKFAAGTKVYISLSNWGDEEKKFLYQVDQDIKMVLQSALLIQNILVIIVLKKYILHH